MEDTQPNQVPSAAVPPPVPEGAPEAGTEGKDTVSARVIGIAVVLVALALGGLYLWGSLIPEVTDEAVTLEKKPESSTVPAPSAAATPSSDEISDLEKETATDYADIGDYTAEINAAFE